MGVVVGDLLLLILIVIVIATAAVAVSLRKEAAATLQREHVAAEQRLQAEREANRQQPGVPLVCLSCDARFLGPMHEDGCPNCHHLSLVITVEELTASGGAGQGTGQGVE